MLGTRKITPKGFHRRTAWGLTIAAGTLALAACGSSATSAKTAPPSSAPGTTAALPSSTPSPASTAGSSAAYTIKTADVAGMGTVLVNGEGQTLYLLNSEVGGKLTCTDANGCTKVWPDTELPDGVTHGIAAGGVNASLLGTVKSPDGKLYLTYGPSQWPLYTFSGDTAAGQVHGQGIHSFGGVWSAITAAGNAATSPASPGTSSSTGGGY